MVELLEMTILCWWCLAIACVHSFLLDLVAVSLSDYEDGYDWRLEERLLFSAQLLVEPMNSAHWALHFWPSFVLV